MAETEGLILTEEQQKTIDGIALVGFSVNLIEGATGSGKTEIYLRLAIKMAKAGRQTLVLVPEIGLTPQTYQRFLKRFGAGVAVSHSGLTEQRACASLA